MKKRMIIFSLLSVMLLSSITGCSNCKEKKGDSSESIGSSQYIERFSTDEINSLDDDKLNANKVTTLDDIVLNSGVKINAEVDMPNELVDQVEVVEIEPWICEKEVVKNYFIKDKKISNVIEFEPYPFVEGFMGETYELENGFILSFDTGRVTYTSPDISEYLSVFRKDISDNLCNSLSFVDKKEFDFMSEADAYKEIRKVLSSIDVTVEDEYLCYYLDFNTLNEEQDKINRQYGLNNIKKWEEKDNGYWFSLKSTLDSKRLSSLPTGSVQNGTYVPGTSIDILYTESAIVYFSVDNYYKLLSDKAIVDVEINTIDKLIECVDEKYSRLIIEESYTVTKIEYCYAAIPLNEMDVLFELTPCWFVTIRSDGCVEKNGSIYSDTYNFNIIFNALTGKEIIIDNG